MLFFDKRLNSGVKIGAIGTTSTLARAQKGPGHSETNKRRGIRPPVGRLWTPKEDALLGMLRDTEVAKRIGRTLGAVRSRRVELGMKRQRWSRRKGAEMF